MDRESLRPLVETALGDTKLTVLSAESVNAELDDALVGITDDAQVDDAFAKRVADRLIRMNGNVSSIRQLVSILIENAVKYCDAGGSIEASAEKTASGRHTIIQVKNDCAEPPEQPERLFDRFYRADKSRKREDGETKSGYGIGLSVAKAVTESHKGKISCKAENGKIVFIVRLRCL